MQKNNTTQLEWTEALPPEGHPKLGQELLRVLGDVIKDKQQLGLHDKWMRAYKLARGKHWEKQSRVPQRTANLVHTHIQRTVNTLTDNNPTFNVSQIGEIEGEEDIFAHLQTACEFWWNEQEQQSVLENSVRNGEIYGITIEKVIFNPDLEYNLGEVETVVVDPYHFGLYPIKCSEIQKASVALHFYPMQVREARRRWPDKADQIKGDGEHLADLGSERREISAGGQVAQEQAGLLATISGAITSLVSRKDDAAAEGDEETLVVEAWVRDYTTTKGEDGTDVPMYPGYIRRVTACAAGLVVVDDRPNPSVSDNLEMDLAQQTFLYDKFPFCSGNSMSEAGSFWGQSDLDQLDTLQAEINKIVSQIAYHKDKAVRPKIINPMDSGVPNEHFTNVSGIVNPSSSMVSQGIRHMELQNNLSDLLETFNLYKELFFQVAGTFELDQAQSPGKNVIAYKAIAALLERAATMMRGKIRNYSRMIRDRGRMYISLMQNYYTEDRWITYDKAGETHTMSIRGTNMIVPTRLTVVSGSTMPQSKVQQREEALELYKMEAIDREELLEKIDWSGRAAVIERMQQGPLGDFLDRMISLGMDQEMVSVLQEVAEMDREDFDKALEAGEIPVNALPETKPEAALALEKIQAEIAKIRAETALLGSRSYDTEATATTRQAGMEYDKDKLEIERVKAVAQLQKGDQVPEPRKRGHSAPGPERGLRTNNQDAGVK